jgi:hypothetical protein
MDPSCVGDKTAAVHRLRVWGFLVVCLAALTVSVTGGRVAAQSADNGLEERSVNSFDFDAEQGVVRVTIDIDLRNVTTDRIDGNVVSRTFFEEYFVAVPFGAENIVATRGGAELGGTLVSDPAFPAFSTYRFPLGLQLFSGQSTAVRVTYDHLVPHPGIGCRGVSTRHTPASWHWDSATQDWSRCGSRSRRATSSTSSPT